jgi:hypothetical protein
MIVAEEALLEVDKTPTRINRDIFSDWHVNPSLGRVGLTERFASAVRRGNWDYGNGHTLRRASADAIVNKRRSKKRQRTPTIDGGLFRRDCHRWGSPL